MMEEDVKIVLSGEDKSAAAFATVSRNADNLRNKLGQMYSGLADKARQAALSYDVMGFSLGRLAAGGALAAFAGQAYQSFTSLERAATRSTLGFRATEAQTRDITNAMKKLSVEIGDASITTESLLKAVGKFGSDGTKSLDQVFAIMKTVAEASRAMNVAPESMATAWKALQRHLKVTDDQAQQLFDHMAMRPISEETLGSVAKLSRMWAQAEGTGVESTKRMFDTINVMKKQYGSAEEAISQIEMIMTRMAGPEMKQKLFELGIAIDWRRNMEEAKAAGKSQLEVFTDMLDIAVKLRGERVIDDILGARQRDTGKALLGLTEKTRAEHEKTQNSQGRVAQINETLNKNQQTAVDRLSISYKNLSEEFGRLITSSRSIEALTAVMQELTVLAERTERAVSKLTGGPMKTLDQEIGDLQSKLKGFEALEKKGPLSMFDRYRKQVTEIELSRAQAKKETDDVKSKIERDKASKRLPSAETEAETLRKQLAVPATAPSQFAQRGVLEQRLKSLEEEIAKLRETIDRNTKETEDAPKKMSYTPSGGGGAPQWVPGFRGGGMWVPGGGAASPPAPPSGPGGGATPGSPPGATSGTRSAIPGLGGSSPATGTQAQRIARSKAAAIAQLRKEGVPEDKLHEAASLLVGQQLSEGYDLDPTLSHDKGTGTGIYGARNDRRDRMFSWMQANGYARDSLEGQSAYMAHEAMTDKRFNATRNTLMSADPATRSQATSIITRNFEAPLIDNSGHRTNMVARAAGVSPDAAAGATARDLSGFGKVLEKQGGGIRNLPLNEQTRGILDAASAKTGLEAHVMSGAQPSSGPRRTGSHRHDTNVGAGDLKLWDPQQKRYLNMRDPNDRARMSAFVEHSVRAGATGVGAGEGYMGAETMHIGRGTPGTWGAGGRGGSAPGWLNDAYKRGQGPEAPGAEPLPRATADQPPMPSDDVLDQMRQQRSELEKPIKLNFDSKGGQFVRSSMRREADRELRESRWDSYADIGAA